MKNILVPTDFSACANYATEMGLALAEFFGATLHLYTSMDNPQSSDFKDCTLLKNSPEGRQFLEYTNSLFLQWKNEGHVRNISIRSICSSGKLTSGIQEYIQKHDIDFVVMGSHGSSGISEHFIGSNTQKVVRSIHVPVFVIKKPLEEYAFKNIIYASNFHENEKESFVRFLKFIEKFNPEKIHLLAVNTVGWFGQDILKMERAMEKFKTYCPFSKCESYVINDSDVEDGIQEFAKKIDADLIVISNHNRNPLKRIFSGSVVEALINHSEIPVLSIDYKENNMITRREKVVSEIRNIY